VELFRLIRPELRFFALGSLFSIVMGISAPLLPTLVVQPLFQEIIGKKQYQLISSVLFWGGLLLLTSILGYFLQNTFFALLSANFARRVRAKIFKGMLGASPFKGQSDSNQDSSSGGRTARLNVDLRELENFLTFEMSLLTGQGAILIFALIMLFRQNINLTFGLILVTIPLAGLFIFVGRRIQHAFQDTQNAVERASSTMSESLTRLEVIKAFRLESAMQHRFEDHNRAQQKATLERNFWSNLHTPASQLMVGIGIGFLVLFSLIEIKAGRMTGVSLITYLTTMVILIGPLQLVGYSFSRIFAMRAPTTSVLQAMSTEPETETGSLEVPMQGWQGQVSFQDVSVRYPNTDNLVFQELNLELKAKEIMAVVGASGGGKTTLTRLLLRFLEPEAGTIYFDGQDIQKYTRAAVRSAIAVVPQQAGLFAMSIAENLRLAKPKASNDELWIALTQAGLKPEINALPSKLETQLGEAGAGLSGGQQQRLAIARALLSGAPILILDEPTSALDGHSEAFVRDTLEGLKGLRTVLVIAHRLSTIENADRIVIIENGKISQSGSHDALMRDEGAYRALVEASSGVVKYQEFKIT
jgi:ABC-type multidrug transport system fused ATPase/permease subunit